MEKKKQAVLLSNKRDFMITLFSVIYSFTLYKLDNDIVQITQPYSLVLLIPGLKVSGNYIVPSSKESLYNLAALY